MKNHILFCILLGVCIVGQTNGQTFYPRCTMSQSEQTTGFMKASTIDPTSGTSIPVKMESDQAIHMLIVFIRFSDDFETTGNWPDDIDNLPSWAKYIVDTNMVNLGTGPKNLTEYFYANSYQYMNVTGEVFYVTLPYPESYYDTLAIPYRNINDDALKQLDTLFANNGDNFKRFDKWRLNGTTWEYEETDKPADQRIDLSLLFVRNTHVISYLAEAMAYLPSSYFEFSGGDKIRLYGSGLSGGITIAGPMIHSNTYLEEAGPNIYGICIHEISHYLLGTHHFGDGFETPIDSMGVKTSSRRSSYFLGYSATSGNCHSSMLGIEKLALEWDIDNVNQQHKRIAPLGIGDTTIRLVKSNFYNLNRYGSDPVITNILEIPLENQQQDIYLEYRIPGSQTADFEASHPPEMGPSLGYSRGVLAYHVIANDATFMTTKANFICADGNYDYELTMIGSDPIGIAYKDRWHKWDIIEQKVENPYNGYSERERICIKDENGDYYMDMLDTTICLWLAARPVTLQGESTGRGPLVQPTNMLDNVHGGLDHVGDVFDLFSSGDIISPYTNPPARFWDAQTETFDTAWVAIQVVREGTDWMPREYVDIRVIRDTALIKRLPPARVKNLRFAESESGDCPVFYWDLNREPRMAINGKGKYIIKRSLNGGIYTAIDSVFHPEHSYQPDYGGSFPQGINKVRYRVHAVDTLGQIGVASDSLEIYIAKGALTSYNTPNTFTGRDLYIPQNVTAQLHLNIPGFTRIHFCPGASVFIDSSVTLKYVETDENSNFVCSNLGKLIIAHGAQVDKLMNVDIEQGGMMLVNDSSRVRMHKTGRINVRRGGYFEANPQHWTVFECYTPVKFVEPYDPSTYWQGINFDDGSSGIINLLQIHGGYPAIYSDNAHPEIRNCTISNNYLGVSLRSGSPVFTQNRVDDNFYVGLQVLDMLEDSLPEIHFNRINNNLYGATFTNCTNTYSGNNLDSNYLGGYILQNVTSVFGYYPSGWICHAGYGNSARYNTVDGFQVTSNANPSFYCLNSIHDNGAYDFDITDAWVFGYKNYPDEGAMSIDLNGFSSFQWLDPFTSYDPVPLKTSDKKCRFAFSNGNMQYDSTLSSAVDALESQLYSPVLSLAGTALSLAQSETQALRALQLYTHTSHIAKLDTASQDPVSRRLVNPYTAFDASLAFLSAHHDSAWMRQCAIFTLANRALAAGDYAGAKVKYLALLGDSSLSTNLKEDSYSSLVNFEIHAFNDTVSAYSHYLAFDSEFHSEKSRVIAKMQLGFLLNEEDIRILKGLPPAPSPQAPVANTALKPNQSLTSTAFPNPFNPATNIGYTLPSDANVYLAVYSMSGAHIRTLVNKSQPKGSYSAPFDASLLPSGIYLYYLVTEDLRSGERKTEQGNMLLTK